MLKKANKYFCKCWHCTNKRRVKIVFLSSRAFFGLC